MSLTNSQYDAVLRLYQEKQLRHKREQDQRIRTAFEKLPRLEEIDREVAALSLKKARILLSKQTAGISTWTPRSGNWRKNAGFCCCPTDFRKISWNCAMTALYAGIPDLSTAKNAAVSAGQRSPCCTPSPISRRYSKKKILIISAWTTTEKIW